MILKNSRNIRNALLLGTIMLLLGACATSSVQKHSFKIAGGETISLPMKRSGAMPAENADIKIEVAGLMVDGKKKEIVYTFGFTEKKSECPQSVKVEDVSGSEAELLVNDTAPKLSETGYWIGNSTGRNKDHPSAQWLSPSDFGDTLKVFRFTISFSDGRTLVMYQAALWSGLTKPMYRQMLGIY